MTAVVDETGCVSRLDVRVWFLRGRREHTALGDVALYELNRDRPAVAEAVLAYYACGPHHRVVVVELVLHPESDVAEPVREDLGRGGRIAPRALEPASS